MILPSLSSLRTFITAAQLESFSATAKTLHITPSAVSHQIKQLEERLNCRLFERVDNKVYLSEDGQRYYQQVNSALELIEQSSQSLFDKSQQKQISLSCVPLFATRWLIPKLSHFNQSHPGWQLNIHTSTQALDLDSAKIDVAIRRGAGSWKGLDSVLLYQENLTPVCHPEFVTSALSLDNLSSAVLLHNENVLSEWEEWFLSVTKKKYSLDVIFQFQNTSQIIEACLEGAGFALIDPLFVKELLQTGKLCTPFTISAPSKRDYYLVYEAKKAQDDKVSLFKSWILAQLPTS
ncbi:LysR substrate-binding domain-containing protein [Pseudoalteromonas rubra]|uniref:HTH lysR-type domain-containing protein n=1 Tax=Pseudoalteromonas rubra TaxID=43658 RepID=A0A0U2XDC7_9GAMM|nr:LysR substrate-binding domain-containing protein [Pseudoalteromonas rubra]ALU45860.1 hypothetical protein AT705_23325 [Pseudoalteromonas rubra]